MKINELRDMKDILLEKELLKLRKEQFELRVQSASGQGSKPNLFGKIRKDIARIKTIQKERKILLKDGKG
ncbi:MAG: 50S ribosomal protein L29 [Gammaproteobacteria bacterium TMED78]|nr:MAG: 50S ribosomal protein L29 [Gammaproteobacteria bacterium TMED78]|tara:strand:- start:438 stop:647 length:210 start_codon:yes stop_codon:yes gene_type:complete